MSNDSWSPDNEQREGIGGDAQLEMKKGYDYCIK